MPTKDKTPDAVVLGAGAVGLCCALELAQAGAEVEVLDPAGPGRKCSLGPSGVLAPGLGPICEPGLLQRRNALKHATAPLYIAEPNNDAEARWVHAFFGSCNAEHDAACMHALCELGASADERFAAITAACAELGTHTDHRTNGQRRFFLTDRGADTNARIHAVRDAGLGVETIDKDAARGLEPGMVAPVAGAVVHAEGGSINPYALVRGIAALAQRKGVRLRTAAADGVLEEHGRAVGVGLASGEPRYAGTVVVATGLDAGRTLEPAGTKLPLLAGVGLHIDIAVDTPPLNGALVLCEQEILCTPFAGPGNRHTVRVSGTLAFCAADDETLHKRRMARLYRDAIDAVPALRNGRVVSRWIGKRPCLPDGMPAVGDAGHTENLYAATGHARMGLTLAPISGAVIAAKINGTTPPVETTTLRAIDPGRFAAKD